MKNQKAISHTSERIWQLFHDLLPVRCRSRLGRESYCHRPRSRCRFPSAIRSCKSSHMEKGSPFRLKKFSISSLPGHFSHTLIRKPAKKLWIARGASGFYETARRVFCTPRGRGAHGISKERISFETRMKGYQKRFHRESTFFRGRRCSGREKPRKKGGRAQLSRPWRFTFPAGGSRRPGVPARCRPRADGSGSPAPWRPRRRRCPSAYPPGRG